MEYTMFDQLASLSAIVKGKGMCSSSVDDEKHCKAIWKINAPGKMLIHLWRFAQDCLPSGMQMQRRHIVTSLLARLAFSVERRKTFSILCCSARLQGMCGG
jgi:hypothetical protein